MKITGTLIETGAAGGGFLAAQVVENKFGDKLKGFAGSAISAGLGTVLIYIAPHAKGGKNALEYAGTSMLAFGVMSGIKKLTMKSTVRRTGLLLDVEQALPGKLLPAPAAKAPGTKAPAKLKGFGNPDGYNMADFGFDDDQLRELGGLSEDFSMNTFAGLGNMANNLV